MPAIRTAAAYAQRAARQRRIVKDNNHFFRRNFIKVRGFAHRLTAVVHIGLRHHQNAPMPRDGRVPGEGFEAYTVDFYMVFEREGFQKKKARVVACKGVFFAGIAQPDNKEFRGGTR
ncbi:hypothetical protein SDC9_198646 [bioreactor metagenome]|uniref:Uncharacterized protein n=1 Tax=bioreactor metagenome TaxID=1076179 RepID=A0A645II92_9ZZZZ